MRLDEFMTSYPQDVKRFKTTLLDINKIFTVLEMNNGEVYVETEAIDEDNVTTVEVLRSNDRKNFTLIWRERYGGNHDDMRTYPRDSQFPLFCQVRLNAKNN
jgi:hypothetical protein